MASTFFTFCGFEGFPGEIASTRLLSNTQEVASLIALISAGIGSVVTVPHNVPDPEEQAVPLGEGVGIGATVGRTKIQVRIRCALR